MVFYGFELAHDPPPGIVGISGIPTDPGVPLLKEVKFVPVFPSATANPPIFNYL